MSEIICPHCRATMVHRSRRRGFREEAILRFIFARPFRCWNCRTRFYRVGRGIGFNLWIAEWGSVPSGAAMIVGGDLSAGGTLAARYDAATPYASAAERGQLQNTGVDVYASDSSGRGETRRVARESSLSGAELGLNERHSNRQIYSSSRRSSRWGQRKIVLWAVIILMLVIVTILYLFSLFGASAKS